MPMVQAKQGIGVALQVQDEGGLGLKGGGK